MARLIKEPHIQLSLEYAPQLLGHNLIDSEFAVEFVDDLARIESYNKHLYRPNSYLHKWWARRCGTTFRAILKHLVRDAQKRDYYVPGGLEGMVILDPMMGGGTTLHEAIRLGASVVGADIDPIPVLHARATLSNVSLARLKRACSSVEEALVKEIGFLYRALCPFCGASCAERFTLYGVRKHLDQQPVLVVDSLVLRNNADGTLVRLDANTYDILVDDRIISSNARANRLPLIEKAAERGRTKRYVDEVDTPYYQRYEPVAVVGECAQHGLFFSTPQPSNWDALQHADGLRATLGLSSADFEITHGPKSRDLIGKGIESYLDLFSSRQLVYLAAAIEQVADLDDDVHLPIAMIVSTSTEFNSMLCGYKGAGKRRPGAIRHTFAHHAYSFPYTALENNPVHPSRASGTLRGLMQGRLIRGKKWAMRPIERKGRAKVAIVGEVDAGTEVSTFDDLRQDTHRFMLLQGSSVSLDLPDNSVDHIVTDPPYYDSVQYGDLAAYFCVWLKQLLPSETDWDYDLAHAAVDQHTNGDGQYESILTGIFSECYRVLRKATGRLVFTYHHWNPKAWAALTIALGSAGFRLVNRYVIHAENQASVHIVNQRALVHDTVLVLGAPESVDQRVARLWPEPAPLDTGDSRSFCEGCGDALGHMLAQHLSIEEIRARWLALIGQTPSA